tara:strand:+ start:315 stop:650 length:336 start_codon:yes stop_codon:yes gene_type:complete
MTKKKNISNEEYIVLKTFEKHPDWTQRRIAKELNLSLGKTNYLIRALIDIGLLKLANFRRSDNKLGYIYILTPEGINEKSKATKLFLLRKEDEYKKLKEEIKQLKDEIGME